MRSMSTSSGPNRGSLASGINALRPLPSAGRLSIEVFLTAEFAEAAETETLFTYATTTETKKKNSHSQERLCELGVLCGQRPSHATAAARRSSTSRARLRYASAPRDFGS